MWLQQNGATQHFANLTIQFLKDKYNGRLIL